ncbi:hypothetical protein [Alicyclobacillus fodiniaquatilis]|uniref:Uncharacterized protein n=1 Tax=Alicyclobacillus fodiniaquatilis TaxID=1661150 RepID=A0ABW4JIN9_9BACL
MPENNVMYDIDPELLQQEIKKAQEDLFVRVPVSEFLSNPEKVQEANRQMENLILRRAKRNLAHA